MDDKVIYKGRDITNLANMMFVEYSKYPTTSFPGASLHEKLAYRAKAAIQAAKEISDISEI